MKTMKLRKTDMKIGLKVALSSKAEDRTIFTIVSIWKDVCRLEYVGADGEIYYGGVTSFRNLFHVKNKQ